MNWKSKIVCTLCMSAMSVTALAQEPVDGKTQPPAPIVVAGGGASPQNMGYFFGFDAGQNLMQQNIESQDFDLAEFVAGFKDALEKKKPKLSDADAQAVIKSIEQLIQKKMLTKAKANLELSNQYLETNKKKDGVQVTKSGLQYTVIKAGTGKQPSLTDTVTVHYEGKLINGTVFDSSIRRNEPAKFPVGRVVPGWVEALQRMKVGDKWQLVLPPSLAYGERGAPPDIGPNEALIFEVELLDVSR
jgi:FKBP-type peptidyl-prolyl cis-trans isomerase FklB